MIKLSKHGLGYTFSAILSISFLCLLSSVDQIRLNSFFPLHRHPSHATSATNAYNDLQNPNPREVTLRVLIGILTIPNDHQHRGFLRQVYGIQPRPLGTIVDIKFVFCNITNDNKRFIITLEILSYDDIIILDCTEDMNNGKTFTYFSSLPAMLSNAGGQPPYDYAMKADDDTYFRLGNLVSSLAPLPREDLYYGYVIPCESMDPFRNYMSGMGYLILWDLVRWISESKIPLAHLNGPEDKVFGEWFRLGHKAKNRFNAKWSMYNYPEPQGRCTHELQPGTVAVHRLKTPEKWIRTLRYFNATMNLKPSKLYNIS